MSKEDQILTSKYTNHNSCLFINIKGKLIRIKCPFEVSCAKSNAKYKQGDILTVTRVFNHRDNSILFEIDNSLHSHHFYKLIIK